MMKLNNKGQVLVCFVIFIPILFMMIALIVNLGLFALDKRRVENTVKDAVKYGINHIDENNIEGTLKELVRQNIDDIAEEDIYVMVDNSYVKVKVTKNYTGVLKYLSNNQTIKISYIGNVQDGKIIISKEE